MEPNPIRVIALCSLILGSFFLAKSVSIKTPKYALHELLAFKVNKSRFFRKYVSQKLESIIGFVFLFVGFTLQIYLEVEALGEKERASPAHGGFTNWWAVIGVTVVTMFAIAIVLNRITRFFSGKIFVEHMRFMVEHHGYPLESDEALLLELGRVMRIPRHEEDTVESYCEKVRAKMKVRPKPGLAGPGPRPLYR
ncbi:MAG: hypothetical protein ACYTEZ_01025 [Planctomycetota bacterium]|jgi:hypothetical protein